MRLIFTYHNIFKLYLNSLPSRFFGVYLDCYVIGKMFSCKTEKSSRKQQWCFFTVSTPICASCTRCARNKPKTKKKIAVTSSM